MVSATGRQALRFDWLSTLLEEESCAAEGNLVASQKYLNESLSSDELFVVVR